MIYYIRDEEGSLIGFKYNNTMYYYIKNMQEDIIGITDENFNQIVSYAYDPWGKIISIKDNNNNEITDPSHIGIINPFRYRSNYYDTETKLYYLNSRYYNPEWGRFLNVDVGIAIGDINNTNLYIYALNNPVNAEDSNGRWPKFIKDFAKTFAMKVTQKIAPIVQKVSKVVSFQTKRTDTYESKSLKVGPIKVSKTKSKTNIVGEQKKINLYSNNMKGIGASVKTRDMTTSFDLDDKELSISSGTDNIQASAGLQYNGLESTAFVSGTYNYNSTDSVSYRLDIDVIALTGVLGGYVLSKAKAIKKIKYIFVN